MLSEISQTVKDKYHIVGKMESVRLPNLDTRATMIRSIHITLSMGPHAQNHALLFNILVPCQLCVHLVYKGIGTSCSVTHDLMQSWITPTPE